MTSACPGGRRYPVRFIAYVSILLLLWPTSFRTTQEPQGVTPQAPEQKAFSQAVRPGSDKNSLFLVSVSGGNYTIRRDGFVEAPGQYWRRHSQLHLGRRGGLERVYFLEHERDLILIYEVSDEQSGWGYVERLDQKTVKPRWVTPVSGYNFGPGLVEANDLYLSAANLIARIDLRSGAYVWQQHEFEKQNAQSFEEFQLPSISGEHVLFPENGAKGRVVEVDKGNGKILSVRN